MIRYGKRRGKVRYLCNGCSKSFSVDYSHNKLNPAELLVSHLDGISLRKLSNTKKNPSATNIFKKIKPLIKMLPSCLGLTASCCDSQKFSGKLVFDGTYTSVKGFEDKIPMIWGFDYGSHDCPHIMLVPSENYQACLKYFTGLKAIKYNLWFLVCDDNEAIKQAARQVYPNVVIQTCLRHFLENLRKALKIGSSDKYKLFFADIKQVVYDRHLTEKQLVLEIVGLFQKYEADRLQYAVMQNIMERRQELTAYRRFKNAPATTNLIEGFNGHLKCRLKSIRGFKSFHSARRWLNAYVLRRRVTPFKACNKKFAYLNGKTPIESTLREGEEIPNLFT